jgi:DNA helicase-2/ATP-dependent DNA helicase PcrA
MGLSFDKKQLEALQFNDGSAIVLAAPGCGKTFLLSMRVFYAHSTYGIPFGDMLCLTFTNRASREMKDRIKTMARSSADAVLSELFVGNLHRFCIRFLFENNIVPINTSIIDDVDQEDIVSYLWGNTRLKAWEVNGVLRRSYRLLAENYNMSTAIAGMYSQDSKFDRVAQAYNRYKQEEQVIDFEDILLLTYKALCEDDARVKYKYSSFRWIEIDEVQDLNPLQLAIVEKLWAVGNGSSIVYFGDERQAIFSFIGAKENSIRELIETCDRSIYLSKNYRSPMYLLDMLNDYAISVLGIDNDKLPGTENNAQIDDALLSVKCSDNAEQFQVIALLARLMDAHGGGKEYTAILVRTNAEVDDVSDYLSRYQMKHIKLSKADMFKSIPFKTIFSHFNVIATETRYQDWIQLLYRTKASSTLEAARSCMKQMKAICLTPHDLMYYEFSSYVIEFENTYRNKEIVLFDTETTGTNVFEDDIIQIAAVKVRNGAVVPGSEFDIIIETDKCIPEYLNGGVLNPMVAEYGSRTHLSPTAGFLLFLEYVGNADLMGHNINFDIHILENNINRRTPELGFVRPSCWDTLKLSRLTSPNLRSHALKDLLEIHHLKGVNSHNAMDDVYATDSLARFLYFKVRAVIPDQQRFLASSPAQDLKRRLLTNYKPIYEHTKQKLYTATIGEEFSFTFELDYVYQTFLSKKYIEPLPMFAYMKDLFQKVVIDEQEDIYFNQQLLNHLYEFRTFNEADLFQNKVIAERVFVMTIHKAKGLEFDNVLLYNISDGVFPNGYFDRTPKQKLESAKVLYVALSRAKKRVYFSYMGRKSRFMETNCVADHFEEYPESQKRRLINMMEISRT